MALRSSPPPFPESNPPSSPPLPAFDHESRPYRPALGKRHLSDFESLSSDPIFSEDASESDEQPGVKRKKQYKGPWWRHASTVPHLRHAGRHGEPVDSGVWMGSDASDDSVAQSQQCMQDVRLTGESVSAVVNEQFAARTASRLPAAEDLALRIVSNCVESCSETIDLSDMSLDSLPDEVIKPLHQLVLSRAMDSVPPGSFVTLTPDIHLYLYGNRLKHLPSELWRLETLAVLSLRNNEVTALPEQIGRLRKLKELNIAGNRIQWLPWQILPLMQGTGGHRLRVVTHPNPMVLPVEANDLEHWPNLCLKNIEHLRTNVAGIRDRLVEPASASRVLENMISRVTDGLARQRSELPLSPPAPIYAGMSEVTYFNIDGSPVRSQSSSCSFSPKEPVYTAVEHPKSPPSQSSLVPSLFELALRSCRISPFIRQFPALLPSDAPHPVTAGLARVFDGQEQGDSRCAVCGKVYVVKRAEWVEYWYCDTDGRYMAMKSAFLPLMRRACSWACAQTELCGR